MAKKAVLKSGVTRLYLGKIYPINEEKSFKLPNIGFCDKQKETAKNNVTYSLHFEIPSNTYNLFKMISELGEKNTKEVERQIWNYVKENPQTIDGVTISPDTHDLDFDIGYKEENNACFIYPKNIQFRIKNHK